MVSSNNLEIQDDQKIKHQTKINWRINKIGESLLYNFLIYIVTKANHWFSSNIIIIINLNTKIKSIILIKENNLLTWTNQIEKNILNRKYN